MQQVSLSAFLPRKWTATSPRFKSMDDLAFPVAQPKPKETAVRAGPANTRARSTSTKTFARRQEIDTFCSGVCTRFCVHTYNTVHTGFRKDILPNRALQKCGLGRTGAEHHRSSQVPTFDLSEPLSERPGASLDPPLSSLPTPATMRSPAEAYTWP